jgi:pimeloyl-ACP methyl ester carboxylesterase
MAEPPAAQHRGFVLHGEDNTPGHKACYIHLEAWERGRLPLRVPVLTVGARSGVGDPPETTLRPLAEHLEAVILDGGHYVPEERPVELQRRSSASDHAGRRRFESARRLPLIERD